MLATLPLAATSAIDRRRLAETLKRSSEQAGGVHADNYDERLEDIQRRRRLAEALSGVQAPQGQMAGRFFVPANPLQHIAALGSQFLGSRMNRRLDKEQGQAAADERKRVRNYVESLQRRASGQPAGVIDESGAMGQPQGVSDSATINAFSALPLSVQRQIVANRVAAQFAPPQAPEPFTLSPGQTRYVGDQVVASVPAAAPTPTDDEREYERARKEGFRGNFSDWLLQQRRAGATNVSVSSEKSLYTTLAENRAKSISDLYDQAVKSPELLQRAQRVKQLVGSDSQALTGLGANWMLGAAKVANQLGIDTGNAASDTELLATQLAASTLDAIKASGLGSGTGFSNADRDFLERVVGGKITLEARTIEKLADLNERAALKTIERWNATASRLDPQQLQNLGLASIEMPHGSPAAGAQPKLQRNPDGSWTYTP